MKPGMIALTTTTSVTGFGLLAYTAREHTMRVLEMPPLNNLAPPASVSIVIKNLNEEAWVARCIESLLNQSIIKRHPGSFEIVFVDGGSDDKSVEIAERYPIKVMVTSKGILHQMNFGIQNTTGDIIVFTDSDSYYPEYWLEKILESFDDDVSMVHTSFIHQESNNYILPMGNLLKFFTGVANGGGQAIRRKVFEETGMFEESQDCIYVARVFQEAEINIVSKAASMGSIKYQWDNPFITVQRRLNLSSIQHQCVRDPNGPNCKFAREVGVTRF